MPKTTDLRSPVPPKQRFARTFYWLARVSFWVQLALGLAASVLFILAIFGRDFSTETNPVFGLAIFLGFFAIAALAFRVYWAYRYTQLAQDLQAANRQVHPRRREIVRVLKVGLFVSMVGLAIAFLGAAIAGTAVLAKAIAQPQGVAVYNPETIVRALDLFLIVANIILIGAHILGSINSLGLFDWITRE